MNKTKILYANLKKVKFNATYNNKNSLAHIYLYYLFYLKVIKNYVI